MIKYKNINLSVLNDSLIDDFYKKLLDEKFQFLILESDFKKYVLTKEKSLFEIDDEEKFLMTAENDIYYKTIIEDTREVNKNDLNIFNEYLNKYSLLMSKNLYGDKYIFGSVAVKTDNGFITTLRGKENLDEYVVVHEVDHDNHLIKVGGKKATLNAPLLSKMFDNEKVKVIVHINHYFDEYLDNYEYAFPGTVRDSFRDNHKSFNIKYHGVIYLFDEEGHML